MKRPIPSEDGLLLQMSYQGNFHCTILVPTRNKTCIQMDNACRIPFHEFHSCSHMCRSRTSHRNGEWHSMDPLDQICSYYCSTHDMCHHICHQHNLDCSYHSGHTVIERTGAALEHTFEIPCSNTSSSATAAYIFVIGSGESVDFSYSPPPKYGGEEYLSGYKGPGANPINWIETAMGFNGGLHVSVKKDSGTPYQLCCCYWKISY